MENIKLGRRQLFAAGGAVVVGSSLINSVAWSRSQNEENRSCPSVRPSDIPQGDIMTPGIRTETSGSKPVFLAEAGTQDVAAIAVAENLFWTDIFMEHAFFFITLMPGDRLAEEREEAQKFQNDFAQQFLKARDQTWDSDSFQELNESTLELVRPFIDYKKRMQAAQEKGELKSLVWPLFFDHTAREAQRFVSRIEQISGGNSFFQYDEVATFWSQIMAEHAQFFAHLLDPQEKELIEKAFSAAQSFSSAELRNRAHGELESMADEIIDFKTSAEQGIETGSIKSIIDPALADHVRREAVKFADELKRTR